MAPFKTCSRCHKEKDCTQFFRHSKSGKLRNPCKECSKKSNQDRLKEPQNWCNFRENQRIRSRGAEMAQDHFEEGLALLHRIFGV